MMTLENLLNGSEENLQSSPTPSKKLTAESQSVDVSMMIETVSGKRVNVTCPDKNDIALDDIAWALSRIPRFAGHTITEIPYNVAQHSVYVASLAEAIFTGSLPITLPTDVKKAVANIYQTQFNSSVLIKAQLHDAHEAYTGDIPSPIKKIPELRDTFKLIEMRLDQAIFAKFNLSELSDDERLLIKFCDKLAQSIEGYQFMPSRGKEWNLPEPSLLLLQKFPAPTSPSESYKNFISHYEYLSDQ